MSSTFKNLGLNALTKIDRLLPLSLRRRGGQDLFRARTLMITSSIFSLNFLILLIIFALNKDYSRVPYGVATILLSLLCIFIITRSDRQEWIGALYFSLLSLMTTVNIYQSGSVLVPGILAYPLITLGGFLFCGRRLGIILAVWNLIQSAVVLYLLRDRAWQFPFDLNFQTMVQSYFFTSLFFLSLSASLISLYLGLIAASQKAIIKEKKWLEKAEHMQELVKLSARIARSVEGPLETMNRLTRELEESSATEFQPVIWVRSCYELVHQNQLMHRFHDSFALLTQALFHDRIERINPVEIAEHVRALCWRKMDYFHAPFSISGNSPHIPVYGKLSSIVLVLVVMIHEVMEGQDPQAELLPPELKLTLEDLRLQVAFDPNFQDIFRHLKENPSPASNRSPRLIDDLFLALQIQFQHLPGELPYMISIPLQGTA